jgi:hypothetical protein
MYLICLENAVEQVWQICDNLLFTERKNLLLQASVKISIELDINLFLSIRTARGGRNSIGAYLDFLKCLDLISEPYQ